MICGASSVTLAVRLIGSPSLYSSALGEPYAFWYASNPVCRALTTAGKTLGATIILATRLARTDPISLNLAEFCAEVPPHGGGNVFKERKANLFRQSFSEQILHHSVFMLHPIYTPIVNVFYT